MDARRFLIIVSVVVLALVALPAAAGAKTLEFRGVVSGSPYGASNGYMAVPVLYSKQTARNAGLKSPVGLLIVRRTQSVKLPSGSKPILPVSLRTGDRFKGTVPMKPSYTKSFYPRITFSTVNVYFRSKELSVSELSAAIDALRNALSDLESQLNALKASSIKAFQDLYNQLADLKKALAALQALSVPNFQAQIDALSKRLDDLIAGLPDFSKFALLSQLPDLTGYAKLTDLPNLTGYAKLTDLPDLSQYLKLSDLTTTLNGNTVITTLQGQVSTLQTTVTTLTTRLNNVCTALKTATIDPDGAGPLGAIGVISLPGLTGVNACGP
jgi:prefoldin subunit 5